MFQGVLAAATQDGDMAAAKLLIDRVILSRRGAPVSFHVRPLKTPHDCALAYAELLEDVAGGQLTPEEAQTGQGCLRSANPEPCIVSPSLNKRTLRRTQCALLLWLSIGFGTGPRIGFQSGPLWAVITPAELVRVARPG